MSKYIEKNVICSGISLRAFDGIVNSKIYKPLKNNALFENLHFIELQSQRKESAH